MAARRISLGLIVASLGAVFLAKALWRATSLEPWSCPDPCVLYQVVWTGDIMVGGAGAEVFREHGYAYAFEKVRPLLQADYVIGNAEAPITGLTDKADPKQLWSYNVDPPVSKILRGVGFSALGLANNHASDRGAEGLRDTIGYLQRAGIEPFGAGMDEAEALRPLLVDTPYGRMAVVGMQTPPSYAATAEGDEPGTAVVTPERVRRARDAARAAGARWLVAYVHWGGDYRGVRSRQREATQLFANAGFDLVVGHGPHIQQEAERIGDTWVLYSLGDFVLATRGRFAQYGVRGRGLVARSFLGEDGFVALELRCILTDNEVVDFQPRLCPDEEAIEVFAGLGDAVSLRDGIGVIEW
ncbi:MAG: CapA family protein [Myxococcales bacterium]|nr:CapA family protein [Myxococcales bacterium]